VRIALEYVESRAQFGRTLTSFPLVRQQLADAQADIYVAETVVRLACDLDARGQDIGLVSLVAKVFASELAWDSIDRAIQLMGGTGYMEESGVARRLRDVRVTRIFEGANDVLRLHLALSALQWPRADLETCPQLSVPAHAAIFVHAFERSASAILMLRKKYGFRFFDQQVLQSHLADTILCAVGILAILLRAESESKILGSNGLSTLAELALDRLSARLDHARLQLDCEATCRRQTLADAIFESMRK
jgi:alkylation response protein AidB-like acyl-CoA dehydrogenase